MSRPWRPLIACLLFGIVAAAGAAEQQADESAIRDVQVRQARAWNSHDASEYASLFTDDGDVVNVLGWWWKGRPEIKARLSDAFAWVFRDSTLTIDDVQVRFLDPSTAVVHVLWTLDGAKVPPGAPAPPRQGIQVQLMRKSDGRWLIASFQNTNSVPETPFPRGPVPSPGAKSPT
ncbi:MAG: SgcJ/EcaC family oxidoreductase [Casimicrobiaceae bacterium]